MKWLRIENDGLLDIRLVALMGGTTKKGKNTIGRFGTGLKYTLAYLFRNNIMFAIYVDGQKVNIGLEQEEISGVKFDIMTVNGSRTSVTTQMGEDWEGWMILREVWCNAIDQGGNTVDPVNDIMGGVSGKTVFYIQIVGQIKEAWEKWAHYFVQEEPVFSADGVTIYRGNGHMALYKQGVLIYEDKEQKSVFRYDIHDATINEMREYRGYMPLDVGRALGRVDAKTMEYMLSVMSKADYEYDLDYSMWGGKAVSTMAEAIGDAKIISDEDLKSFKERGIEIDEARYVVVSPEVFRAVAAHKPSVSAVRRAEKVGSFIEVIDPEFMGRIEHARMTLETCGYWIDPELTIIVGAFGDGKVLGRISFDDKVIMMSERLKTLGQFDVLTTLIEENEHFRTQYADCTREFQQHFINLYAKELLMRNNVRL